MATRAKNPHARGQVPATQRPADDDDEESEPTALPPDDRPPPRSSGDEVEQLLEQLGASASGARIIVHRIAANADPEECIDCPLSVFSKDQLRSQFGAGRYSCEVRSKGVIRRRWEWRFAAPNVAPGAAATLPPQNQQIEALQRQLQDSAERDRQRSHDLIVALIGRPQQREQPQGLQIGDLVQFKELFGGGGGSSALSQFKEFLALRDLAGGGGDEKGTTGMDLAIKALDVFPKWLAAGATPRALPAPREGKAPPPAAPVPAQPNQDKRERFAALVLQHAKQGTPPALAANFLFEQMQSLEDSTYDSACSLVESEGAVNLALLIEPRLEPARAWLQQLVEELRGLISTEPAAPELTESAAGHQPAGEVPPSG